MAARPPHLRAGCGAAYGTFGDYDGEIDSRADGLAGVHDPDWTGFYRWSTGCGTGRAPAQLHAGGRGCCAERARCSPGLAEAAEIALLDVGLRTHEILENALQFQLTGHDDYGSGTTLATTRPTSPGPGNC